MVNKNSTLEDTLSHVNSLYNEELGHGQIDCIQAGETIIKGKVTPTYKLSIIPEDDHDGDYQEDLTHPARSQVIEGVLRGLELAGEGRIKMDGKSPDTKSTGWNNNANPPLEFWKVLDVEPLDTYPDWVSKDDGPFGVEHISSGKCIGIDYIPDDALTPVPDDVEKPTWEIKGPNTVIYYTETLEEAQEKLYNYVSGRKSVSAMI